MPSQKDFHPIMQYIFCCHACSIPGINKVSVAISSVSSHTVKLALRFTIYVAIELVQYIYYNIYFVLLLHSWAKLQKPAKNKILKNRQINLSYLRMQQFDKF